MCLIRAFLIPNSKEFHDKKPIDEKTKISILRRKQCFLDFNKYLHLLTNKG